MLAQHSTQHGRCKQYASRIGSPSGVMRLRFCVAGETLQTIIFRAVVSEKRTTRLLNINVGDVRTPRYLWFRPASSTQR